MKEYTVSNSFCYNCRFFLTVTSELDSGPASVARWPNSFAWLPRKSQYSKPAKRRLMKRNTCLLLALLFYYTFSFHIFKAKESLGMMFLNGKKRSKQELKTKKAHIQGCVCPERMLWLGKRNPGHSKSGSWGRGEVNNFNRTPLWNWNLNRPPCLSGHISSIFLQISQTLKYTVKFSIYFNS